MAAVLRFLGGKVLGAFMPQLHGLSVTLFTVFVALGLALVVGVASSFVPAWNAAKTNILDSLRYAG